MPSIGRSQNVARVGVSSLVLRPSARTGRRSPIPFSASGRMPKPSPFTIAKVPATGLLAIRSMPLGCAFSCAGTGGRLARLGSRATCGAASKGSSLQDRRRRPGRMRSTRSTCSPCFGVGVNEIAAAAGRGRRTVERDRRAFRGRHLFGGSCRAEIRTILQNSAKRSKQRERSGPWPARRARAGTSLPLAAESSSSGESAAEREQEASDLAYQGYVNAHRRKVGKISSTKEIRRLSQATPEQYRVTQESGTERPGTGISITKNRVSTWISFQASLVCFVRQV